MNGARGADVARLIDIIEQFPRESILVLGDFVADEFVFGEISRVSREAPVLILRRREMHTLPGGGANAVNNLADLGARVYPVATLGDDTAGDVLAEYFRKKKVDTAGLLRRSGWTTPAKTRFLAGWPHTAQQQVLRVDREPDGLPDAAIEMLVRKARERIADVSAVLISDYGYGSATPEIVASIRGRKRWARPVTLDSRYRLHAYAGLDLTAATPNEAEIEAAHNAQIAGDPSKLDSFARRTMARLNLSALVVTRGRHGMTVFERGRAPQPLAVFGSDQAVDVTGAGDTVIAAFTLALAAGASVPQAARIANYAGGIVVMKRGTATVTREELMAAIRSDASEKCAEPGRSSAGVPGSSPRTSPTG
ncbi:MAG TPA: PfkB family carbohydrate kinase [Rugosimonospora sp.]|nr:PfkB family carbohydrate kinase [Rugosimonospora sp.]